jgi:Fe-S-cluster containining protein
MLTVNVTLSIGGRPLAAEFTVPEGPARVRDVLPAIRSVVNQIVDMGVEDVEAAGERVSCRKGCGACCRQLVPISPSEAQAIRDLVEAMPEDRRQAVGRRMAEARDKVESAGLLGALLGTADYQGSKRELAERYFRLGIPCPFLEDESCSIHPDRPVACREYLVTSPAEHCAQPTPETIRKVPVKGNPIGVMMAFDARGGPPRWVPLALAPEWVGRHPLVEEKQEAVELMKSFFTTLARAK